MATSFSLAGTLRIVPQWTDDLNTTTVVDSATVLVPLTLTNGEGEGEANAFWKDVRTVAAGGSDVVNPATLSLNVFGGTGSLSIDPTKLRMLYVRNRSETQELLLVLSDDDETPLPPLASILLFWPKNTSAGVGGFASPNGGDLNVSNPGASAANYEIVLVGVKA